MRLRYYLSFLLLISCSNTKTNNLIPTTDERINTEKNIIGVWELYRQNYSPSDSLRLVTDREYLEIKSENTYIERNYAGKWYLSYTDKSIVEPSTNIIFTELYSLNPSNYLEYHRLIEPFYLQIKKEKEKQYLYLYSIKTSATRVFTKKE
ncbi:MAG: hypothetical protein GC171_17115 [Terrimonas sp.]|nr:hypothetical protein [Terrimonas sp.]